MKWDRSFKLNSSNQEALFNETFTAETSQERDNISAVSTQNTAGNMHQQSHTNPEDPPLIHHSEDSMNLFGCSIRIWRH